MLKRMNVFRLVATAVFLFPWMQTSCQETPVPAAETSAIDGTSSAKSPESDKDIPLAVLQQIISGISDDGPIKADLSKDQIDAMKTVQRVHFQKTSRLNELAAFLSSSPLNNRRICVAMDLLKAEGEAALKKDLLSHITPEQQNAIRRRNRAAIVRAVSRQQFTGSSASLLGEKPIDTLMTNNDMMSVLERPAVQDLLELSDEQFEKLEELTSQAEADAVTTIQQMLKSMPLADLADDGYVSPNSAFEQLNSETLKLLTKEQAEEYQRLKVNPFEARKLIEASGEQDPHAAMKLMMPHGMSTRTSIQVKNGETIVDADFHNAFAQPVMIKTLELTEEQQTQIANLLKDSREKLLEEITARTNAYNKRRAAQHEKASRPLQSHVDKFHVLAVSLLDASQLERLEKERLKGIGLLAFKKPHVCEALGLTEEQKKAIEEIASRVPKQLEYTPPTIGGDFQKESEAFFKKARENQDLMNAHVQKQNEDLQTVLSETQQKEFTEMTGYVFISKKSI